MASETSISAEDFAALAVDDPKAWVKLFLEHGEQNLTFVDYFDEIEPLHGLEMILVSREGGCEGGGEHAERTFAIAEAGSPVVNGRVSGALAYVEFHGYYASEYGTEWDSEIHVVEPRDVMVVQYHAKK